MAEVLVLRCRKGSLDLYKREPFSGKLSFIAPDPNKISLLSPFLTDTYLKDQNCPFGHHVAVNMMCFWLELDN